MKKLSLLAAVTLMGLAGFATSSNAYDRQVEPRNRTEIRERYRDRDLEIRQLRAELYQLDLMFWRIDSRIGYYHGRGSNLRWHYSRLQRDRERLNYELTRRPLDRLRIHSQIDRIRDELREIEVQARVRSHRYR